MTNLTKRQSEILELLKSGEAVLDSTLNYSIQLCFKNGDKSKNVKHQTFIGLIEEGLLTQIIDKEKLSSMCHKFGFSYSRFTQIYTA